MDEGIILARADVLNLKLKPSQTSADHHCSHLDVRKKIAECRTLLLDAAAWFRVLLYLA